MTEEYLRWFCAVDRLLMPDHAGLNGHLFVGEHHFTRIPVVVPADRQNPHVWVVGGSGTGKTSRFLAPYTAQRIAAGHSVVVLDPKPDKSFFYACRDECHHQGVPFRWVDITPGRWSYAFSPFAQSHAAVQTLSARAEILIQALNLDYGPVYGGSYFTAMDELFTLAVLTMFPEATTPAEIATRLDNPAALKKHLGEKGWEDSNHIRAIFAKLAGATPLNVSAKSRGVGPDVLAAAIDLRQPFYTPQVVYFALDAKEMRTTTRATIGLAFYNLLAAAKYVGPEPAVKVVCVIDEAQEVVGSNLSILLEQARSLSIELVLAHQNLGQLKKANQDYRETLEENAGLQVVFNPSGTVARDWIEGSSGEELHAMLSWRQTVRHGFDPQDGTAFHPKKAKMPSLFDFPQVSVSEQMRPIWSKDDLMRLSAVPGLAWVRLLRDEGYARHQGQWQPTRMLFNAPWSVYRDRMSEPWPGPNGQTVLVEQRARFDRRFEEPPEPTPAAEATKRKIRRIRNDP